MSQSTEATTTAIRPRTHDDPTAVVPEQITGARLYRDVEYAVIPGFRPLLLDLMVPSHVKNPALVISVHGGAWLSGSHKDRADDPNHALLFEALLTAGFAVATVQYRLSKEVTFPAQAHDVSAAIRWLRSAADVVGINAESIGLVGDSAGGHLVLIAGANSANAELEGDLGIVGVRSTVEAVTSWYGPTRLDTMDAESLPHSPFAHDAADSPESILIGGQVPLNTDKARWSSPISHVSERSAPTLMLHGTQDAIVPFQQSVAHHEALESCGVESTLRLIDGADHGFVGVDIAPLIAETVNFFREKLK